MPREYAAHVDSPIAHGSNAAQLTLGIAAVVIAAVVVVYSGGTALIAFGAAAEGVGQVALAGNLAMLAGKGVDSVIGPSAECFVASGIPTVLLGPTFKPAARADIDDTKTRGWHVQKLAEGSNIVFLGAEHKPMSRRGDRGDEGCGGKIMDGIHTVIVGGDPSRQGVAIAESSSPALEALTTALDIAGGASTVAKGGALNLVQGGLQLGAVPVGGEAGKIMKALGTGVPGNPFEAIDAANTLIDGASTVEQLATQPRPPPR